MSYAGLSKGFWVKGELMTVGDSDALIYNG